MNTSNTHNHIGRNTIYGPKLTPKRARPWCFTWNNYTEENWHSCTARFSDTKSFQIKKMVFQEERGENGTPHIQGFIQFVNAINFTTVKNIDKKIHWEMTINIPASINYCSDPRKRVGRIFWYGIRNHKNMDDNEKKEKYVFEWEEFRKYMLKLHKEELDEDIQDRQDRESGLIPPLKTNT